MLFAKTWQKMCLRDLPVYSSASLVQREATEGWFSDVKILSSLGLPI